MQQRAVHQTSGELLRESADHLNYVLISCGSRPKTEFRFVYQAQEGYFIEIGV